MRQSPQKKEVLSSHLNDHHHRLVSLQISLQEAFKNGHLSDQQYQPRLSFINSQLETLTELRSWQSAEESSISQEKNLGLPNLELCTPEEHQICFEFLKQRHRLLEKLLKESSDVLQWVEDASRSARPSFFYTLQLSKLRKFLDNIDKLTTGLSLDEEELNNLMIQLGNKLSLQNVGRDVIDNLQAIMKIFSDLDNSSARVAQLRALVRTEEDKVNYMKAWLKRYEKTVQSPVVYEAGPTTQELSLYEQSVESMAKDPLLQTRSRLSLAKEYIQSHLKTENYTEPKERTSTLDVMDIGKLMASNIEKQASTPRKHKNKKRGRRWI